MTTSIAAPKRSQDYGSRQELRDPAHLEDGQKQEQDSRRRGDPGNERGDLLLVGDAGRENGARGHGRQT